MDSGRTGSPGPGPGSEEPGPGDPLAAAEAYVLNLLALRPRTVWELKTRLRSKGYAEDVISELLERCSRAGYVDDRSFSRQFVEERCRSIGCGAARLRQELRRKGVPADVVAEVLGEMLTPERELELAVQVASRRAVRLSLGPDGGRAKEKVWGVLRRRGFSLEICRQAVRAVFGAEPEDAEPDRT